MLNDNIHQYGNWRSEISSRLWALLQWLEQHDLLTADVKTQIEKMQAHNRSDKIMVAFVAELSHGKSELINAIFFAGRGRRIIRGDAMRKTLCPIELGYDESDAICLRLLPIQTRLEPQSLMEWRQMPEQWSKIDLVKGNTEQLVSAINKISETIEVSLEEARALGFLRADAQTEEQGSIEIPKWRHALINIDHPLLKQGLVILDTPGLNTIGAEPDLAMSLIPQAQAVIFIMSAYTGVTASDMAMWDEFLSGKDKDISRFVVLNKIDTLWDDLCTLEENDAVIEQKRLDSAHLLDIAEEQVMAISAQKGLRAKINGDTELLERSHLNLLENVLSQRIVQRRDEIMYNHMNLDIGNIRQLVDIQLKARSAELSEQLAEMNGLRGKNETIMQQQRIRICDEQDKFEVSVGRMHAVRIVHYKILQQIYSMLGNTHLLKETAQLKTALNESGFMKIGIKKVYADTFTNLYTLFDKAQDKVDEVHTMFGSMFQQINKEYGFKLQVDDAPQLSKCVAELKEVEEKHAQYLGVGNLLQLAQQEFVDRLLRTLVSQLRSVFEKALNEVEQWSRGVSNQIDTQLRERRRSLKRRLTAIERAETASSGLEERIQEIQRAMLDVQHEQSIFNALLERVLPPVEFQQSNLAAASSITQDPNAA